MLGRVYDVAVIGGGLSGTAVARDAAGRRLSVFLCDEGDLGAGSSSATSKIVHGGLRLLGGLQLGAMREAVVEREFLLHAAPHLVRPLRFLIPRHERQVSASLLGIGLFAFDHVARHSLPRAAAVDLERHPNHDELHPHFRLALTYSDCVADDSRLVILNALDAREHGASIYPRVRCTVAERDGGRWRLSLESTLTGEPSTLLAKVLVNAGGAAVGEVANHVIHSGGRTRVRMAKGSHIVVRRERRGEVGYSLPAPDGRIVHAVPYGEQRMLIGMATSDFTGDPAEAAVERSDVAYLLDVANQYFEEPVRTADIVWAFACVRTLPVEPGLARGGRAVTVDAPSRMAPLVSVFGGTLTSHRRLAEHAVDRIGRFANVAAGWTAGAVLPGGGFPRGGEIDLVRGLRAAYPFVTDDHARRLVRTYGTRASSMLFGTRSAADLGACFGDDLTEAEVNFLRHDEWAMTGEDVLWRRTKLGLQFTAAEAEALSAWMADRTVAPVSAA